MTVDVVQARTVRRALVTPALDFLLGGGLSLFALPLLLLFVGRPLTSNDYGTTLVLVMLFNWPHFVSSYFLLYSSRQSISEHKVVSLWIPALLLVYAGVSIVTAQSLPWVYNLLVVFGGLYLARHYTGQTFGVMSTMAYVSGLSFDKVERRQVRFGINVLMAWHVLWGLTQSFDRLAPAAMPALKAIYAQSVWVFAFGVLCGSAGLLRFARRVKQTTQNWPVRVCIPWLALIAWYVSMAVDPSMLLVVQVAHALQYLVFPIRAEINRGGPQEAKPRHWLLHMALWLVLGFAVFEGIEPLFGATYRLAGGRGQLDSFVAPLLITCIAVHHYFIDGALYKLRNPRVRSLLFAHLGK